MRLSARQWAALSRTGFASRMITLLRRNDPAGTAGLDDAALATEIDRQAERAQRYGLRDQRSAATFVVAAWQLGPDFDTRIPALAQILGARELSAPRKCDALENFTQTVFHALATAGEGAA